jgi:hypothetical protein
MLGASGEDRATSAKHLARAELISVQLRVVIPEVCLRSVRCLRAYLDFYAPQPFNAGLSKDA